MKATFNSYFRRSYRRLQVEFKRNSIADKSRALVMLKHAVGAENAIRVFHYLSINGGRFMKSERLHASRYYPLTSDYYGKRMEIMKRLEFEKKLFNATTAEL